jgi:hypothetical protein
MPVAELEGFHFRFLRRTFDLMRTRLLVCIGSHDEAMGVWFLRREHFFGRHHPFTFRPSALTSTFVN